MKYIGCSDYDWSHLPTISVFNWNKYIYNRVKYIECKNIKVLTLCVHTGDCGKVLPAGQVICGECAGRKPCSRCRRKLRLARFTISQTVCDTCVGRRVRQTGGAAGRPNFVIAEVGGEDDSGDFTGYLSQHTPNVTSTLQDQLGRMRWVIFICKFLF